MVERKIKDVISRIKIRIEIDLKKGVKMINIEKLINKLKCKKYGHDYDFPMSSYSQLVSHNYIQTCKRCGQQWELKEKFRTY